MSKIVISDLHRSESKDELIDLSNDEQKTVNGGRDYLIVVVDHGDHLHVYIIPL